MTRRPVILRPLPLRIGTRVFYRRAPLAVALLRVAVRKPKPMRGRNARDDIAND